MISICRLCLKEATLQNSHVIPKFFAEGVYYRFATGKSGASQPFMLPVNIDPKVKMGRMQKGFWEKKWGFQQKLLCEDCEKRVGALENYAKKLFYGRSNPIRLKLPILEDPFFQTDYRKLKLFQMSLLWRASEAKGLFFRAVDVGKKHSENLRQKLFEGDPGNEDEYPCAMARLIAPKEFGLLRLRSGKTLEDMVFAPVAKRWQGKHVYTFMMGGLVWIFAVSSTGPPEIMKNAYLHDSGVFFLTNFDARRFLHEFSWKLLKAGNIPDHSQN